MIALGNIDYIEQLTILNIYFNQPNKGVQFPWIN